MTAEPHDEVSTRVPAPGAGGFDELTARSAVLSLWLSGVAVALPALVRPEAAAYYLTLASTLLAAGLLLALLRRWIPPRRTALAALATGAGVAALAAWLTGGPASPALHAYSVVVVAGAWLVFSPIQAWAATVAVILAGGGFAWAATAGLVPAPWVHHNPWSLWLTTAAACVVVSVIQRLEVHRLRTAVSALHGELSRSDAAHHRLASSERRYAEIVSTVPEVVYEFEVRPDGARAFTFISDGVRRLLECSPDEVLASADVIFDLIDPRSQMPAIEASIAHSYTTLTPWQMEGTLRTRSGHLRTIRGHSLPARRADGTVRWHGVLTDLTERVKSEHALRESQEAVKHSLSLLQSAFESTADGLLVVDSLGRVSGYNQKFLSLWRVPQAIAQAHDDRTLLAHVLDQLAEPEAFLARVTEVYQQADTVTFDTLVFKDGRRYERYSQPQVVDGVVAGRVWSFRDVTARVEEERRRGELELQLQQAHTLEALGTLAGGIAHDFNNLLTIILANAEQALIEDEAAERTACLTAVKSAADRAGALVREIREFSRPRASARAVVAVADTIASALQLLRSTMPKTIDVITRLDPRVTMFANATQVQQVATNLVLNAAQAIGDASGRITITLEEVSAAAAPATAPRPLAERYACLSVSDTGRGIAADALPRIFEPFYTTKAPAAGTGLGLAVVHGIVHRYHGAVVVESTPGSGSCFRVFWPALPPAAAETQLAAPAVAASQRGGGGRRVLVVDDEPDIVRVVAEGLRRMGYAVSTSTDPEDAWGLFATEPGAFDAVLTDLSMPRLSGLALGRRMLDRHPSTPIVLFTGYSAELSPDEARAAGFRAVLNKPMTLPVLAEALHRILDDAAPAPAPATSSDRTGTRDS